MRILFVLAIFCLSSQLYSQESDYLKFDTRSIDLGIVKKGDIREGTFTFKNVSNEPIEIEWVDACECTELDWTFGKIKPGETGTIQFIFDSSKKDLVEPISIDITLKNTDSRTGGPILDSVAYLYKF